MSKLILDALYPPGPDQLIADLSSVGADGALVYAWRPGGVGGWTPGHVAALRTAGKLAVPVIVPDPAGGDIAGILADVRAMGFNGGPLLLDLEPPNLPSPAWEKQLDDEARAQGFFTADYGTWGNLGPYDPGDPNWVASWRAAGQLQPVPALPAGEIGWQFVNDVNINGTAYDASVVDNSWLGRGGGKGNVIIEDTVTGVSVGGTVYDPSGAGVGQQWLNWSDLTPVAGQEVPVGTEVNWTEAKKVGGIWYDRVEKTDGTPGDWCLPDFSINDGGFTPDHFRPAPPTPVPVPVPDPSPLSTLTQQVQQLRTDLDALTAKLRSV